MCLLSCCVPDRQLVSLAARPRLLDLHSLLQVGCIESGLLLIIKCVQTEPASHRGLADTSCIMGEEVSTEEKNAKEWV